MWFKVDDGFAVHPKAVMAGNAALGLWVRAGAWSGFHLTDGVIPRHVLSMLGGKPKDAAALVTAGLWATTADGWAFHDWATYQPSRAEVDAKRAWDRQRMELHRDRTLVAAIRRRDCDRCRYCARKVRWNVRRGNDAATYDQVIPNGENNLENVVVACGPCSITKDSRTLADAGMTLLQPGSLGPDGTQSNEPIDLFRSKNAPTSEQAPDPTRPDPSSSLREEEDGSGDADPDADAPASGDAALAAARVLARAGVARLESRARPGLPARMPSAAPRDTHRLREPEPSTITAQSTQKAAT